VLAPFVISVASVNVPSAQAKTRWISMKKCPGWRSAAAIPLPEVNRTRRRLWVKLTPCGDPQQWRKEFATAFNDKSYTKMSYRLTLQEIDCRTRTMSLVFVEDRSTSGALVGKAYPEPLPMGSLALDALEPGSDRQIWFEFGCSI
jgi:hypothetical protein